MDDTRPILYQFENGVLNKKAKEKTNITCMQSVNASNKRILTANVGELDYSGNILQKNQSHVRYYLGVVDKKSKRIERIESCLHCTLKPKIKAATKTPAKPTEMKYREKLDNLIEAFGSAKQKRGLSTRKKNEKVHGTMSDKVQQVVEGVLEKKPDIAQTPPVESIEDEILPPRNLEAVHLNDIYHVDDIVSYRIFQNVLPHTQQIMDFTQEDLEMWKSEKKYSNFLLDHLTSMPENHQEKEKKAAYLIYLDCMIAFSQLKYSVIKKKAIPSSIPGEVMGFLLDDFTEGNEHNGQRFIPRKMKDKLLCYILVLALIIDGFELRCQNLLKDLKIGLARVVKMLRFIGCTVRTHGTRKRKESGEASDPEVVAVLSLAKEKTASTKKEPKTPSKKEPETPSKKEPETPKKKRTKTPKPEKPPTPAKETNIDSSEQSVPKKKIKNEPTF